MRAELWVLALTATLVGCTGGGDDDTGDTGDEPVDVEDTELLVVRDADLVAAVTGGDVRAGDPTHCALICDPTADPDPCGDTGSCKHVPGQEETVGVCTWP